MNIYEAWIKAKKTNGSITRYNWLIEDETILCLFHGMDNLVREFRKGETERGDMFTKPHRFCVADIMAYDWMVTHIAGYHNQKRERLSNELIEKNGGWPDSYKYAHCSSDGKIYLTQYKPKWDDEEKVWRKYEDKEGLFLKFKWGEGLRAEVDDDYSKIIVQRDITTEGDMTIRITK